MKAELEKSKEVELKDITKIITGFAFKSELFNDQKIGIPLIRIRDLEKGKSDTYYSGKYEKEYVVEKGDLLIGMDGEFKIFQWKSDLAILNQRVCKLIINEKLAIPKYIFYMISKKLKEIEDKTPFVTVKHISSKQILSIKLILPHPTVQQQVVVVLEKAEKLKKFRNDADKLTKDFLKSVFLDLFGDPVENKKKWKKSTIGENLLEIKYGTGSPPQYVNNGVKFIRATNIKDGRIVENGILHISETEAKKIEKCKLSKDDLIIVRSGVNAGDCAVVTTEYVDAYGGYDIIFHPNNKVLNSTFLNEMLNLASSRSILEQLSRRAGQPHLNTQQISDFEIILPPIDIQNKFADIVTEIEEIRKYQKQSSDHIQVLFNNLMQKAFRGEIVC